MKFLEASGVHLLYSSVTYGTKEKVKDNAGQMVISFFTIR
jgi:hypothetical protein